jgi:SSS family solute:Na+ symporter
MIGVYSHLIILVVGYLASFLFPSAEVHEDLTVYAWWDRRKKVNSNN